MSTEPIKQHIIAILERIRDKEKLLDQHIAEHTAQGRTVVYTNFMDRTRCEVSDHDTGQVIATGGGGQEGIDALAASPEAATWVWFDSIIDDLLYSPTGGLPVSLCDALDDWIGTLSVADEDIAQVIGWDAADVAAIRRD